MSIPLIQKPEKDDINTSIIAIKRNIERINMLLGLMDNDSPDLSGFATKQELQDAVTELQPVDEVTVGNMQSVTSNAVSKALAYSTAEIDTGLKWINGKTIYRKSFYFASAPSNGTILASNVQYCIDSGGTQCWRNTDYFEFPYVERTATSSVRVRLSPLVKPNHNLVIDIENATVTDCQWWFLYTKTTD